MTFPVLTVSCRQRKAQAIKSTIFGILQGRLARGVKKQKIITKRQRG